MVRCDPIPAAERAIRWDTGTLCVPTQIWLTESTRVPRRLCAGCSPSQHGPVRLLHHGKRTALQPCYWNLRKTQPCFNFPWKHKLLLSVCIAKLLLLWLLVVIYQLHSGSAADFSNYSGFTLWFHPHFISTLLQHALYMLCIPPARSVLYVEMMDPRSPRVCLKNLYSQVSS